MVTALRALLALVLLVGVYVMLVVTVCAWAVFAVLGVWSSITLGQIQIGLISLATFLIPVVLAIGSVLVALTRSEPLPEGSIELTDQTHPLWRAVTDITERTGTVAPGRILLTAKPNAAVTETRLLLGLVPARQPILFVGTSLLTLMPRAQLDAILAHELEHYDGRHDAFSISIVRGWNTLETSLARIQDATAGSAPVYGYSRLVVPLLRGFRRLYELIATPVRHRHEYEADAAAADVCGSGGPVAEALKSAYALQSIWELLRTKEIEPIRSATNLVPDNIDQLFADTVQDYKRDRRFEGLQDHWLKCDEGGSTHPPLRDRIAELLKWDEGGSTHPPLRDRIAAVRRGSAAVVTDDHPLCTVEEVAAGPYANALAWPDGVNRVPTEVWRRRLDEALKGGAEPPDPEDTARRAAVENRERAKATAWRMVRHTSVPMMVMLGLVWLLPKLQSDDVKAYVPTPECAGIAPATILPSASPAFSQSPAGVTELWDASAVVRIAAENLEKAKIDEGWRDLASLGVTPPPSLLPPGPVPAFTPGPVPVAEAEGALALSLDKLADVATRHFDRDLAAAAADVAVAERRNLAESDGKTYRPELAAALVRYAAAVVAREHSGSVPSGISLPFWLERNPLSATQAAAEAVAIYRDLSSPDLATATAVLAAACAPL